MRVTGRRWIEGGMKTYLLTVDKNIETTAQSRVDIFNCILQMWLEVLALEV